MNILELQFQKATDLMRRARPSASSCCRTVGSTKKRIGRKCSGIWKPLAPTATAPASAAVGVQLVLRALPLGPLRQLASGKPAATDRPGTSPPALVRPSFTL